MNCFASDHVETLSSVLWKLCSFCSETYSLAVATGCIGLQSLQSNNAVHLMPCSKQHKLEAVALAVAEANTENGNNISSDKAEHFRSPSDKDCPQSGNRPTTSIDSESCHSRLKFMKFKAQITQLLRLQEEKKTSNEGKLMGGGKRVKWGGATFL